MYALQAAKLGAIYNGLVSLLMSFATVCYVVFFHGEGTNAYSALAVFQSLLLSSSSLLSGAIFGFAQFAIIGALISLCRGEMRVGAGGYAVLSALPWLVIQFAALAIQFAATNSDQMISIMSSGTMLIMTSRALSGAVAGALVGRRMVKRGQNGVTRPNWFTRFEQRQMYALRAAKLGAICTGLMIFLIVLPAFSYFLWFYVSGRNASLLLFVFQAISLSSSFAISGAVLGFVMFGIIGALIKACRAETGVGASVYAVLAGLISFGLQIPFASWIAGGVMPALIGERGSYVALIPSFLMGTVAGAIVGRGMIRHSRSSVISSPG